MRKHVTNMLRQSNCSRIKNLNQRTLITNLFKNINLKYTRRMELNYELIFRTREILMFSNMFRTLGREHIAKSKRKDVLGKRMERDNFSIERVHFIRNSLFKLAY